MKTIWLTSLDSSRDPVEKLMAQMKPYGIEIKGHFWVDNLEKMAWLQAREELLKPDVMAWLILASQEKWSVPSIRYGLSLLRIMLQAKKGVAFPTGVLFTGEEGPSLESFPTPLRGVEIFSLIDPSLSAKLVAKAYKPPQEISGEYRMDIHGTPAIGQWFEIGPQNDTWSGAMFGVAEGEIHFHAVGPKGSLPAQAVVEYPVKGLKMRLGEKDYTAWAVQNEMNPQVSYFVKISGYPETILFGSYSSQEEAEMYIVRLK